MWDGDGEVRDEADDRKRPRDCEREEHRRVLMLVRVLVDRDGGCGDIFLSGRLVGL